MNKLLLSTLLASTFAFTACTTTSTAPTTSTEASTPAASTQLANKTWSLTHLDGVAIAQTDTQKVPNLQFDSATQRVSGSDGCNRVMGGYTATGFQLKFGALASTMMACIGDDNANISSQYGPALAKVASYQITDQILVLKDTNGKVVLQFTATK